MGTNADGVWPNCTPYRMKLSKILRRFNIMNIMPIKLRNPRNLCVGD